MIDRACCATSRMIVALRRWNARDLDPCLRGAGGSRCGWLRIKSFSSSREMTATLLGGAAPY